MLVAISLLYAVGVSVVIWGDTSRSPWPPMARGVVLAAPGLVALALIAPLHRRSVRPAVCLSLLACAIVTYHLGGIAYTAVAFPLALATVVRTTAHELRALWLLTFAHFVFGVLAAWSFGGIFLGVGSLLLAFLAGHRAGRLATETAS